MTQVKIKDKDALYRDMSSGAIINTNVSEYENFKRKQAAAMNVTQRLDQTSQEIKELKSEMTEIKTLLVALLNKDN
jgi:hypothetical protein